MDKPSRVSVVTANVRVMHTSMQSVPTTMAPTISELRKMSDDELIARHDEGVQHVFVGVDYYLAELARRQANRQMQSMLTLTVVIAAATILALATSVAALRRR